jgi:hypothetical protein
VRDLLSFVVRFTFLCPLCKRLNDQNLTIRATSREAVQEEATSRLIRCAFCPAKVGADAGMLRITESSTDYAFGVGEGDFVALLHQGANRNRSVR